MPRATVPRLSIFVLASVLIHFALICAIEGWLSPTFGTPYIRLDYVFSLASLGSEGAAPYEKLAENLQTFVHWIAAYFFVSMALGFLAGFGIGKLILKGPLRFFATHSWLYDVFGRDHRKQKGIIFAYVLSTVEHEGKRILYCGDVKKCQYQSDGTLAYVVLASPRRGLMKLNDTITTSGSDGTNHWQVLELSGRNQPAVSKPGSNLLYIKGEHIVNVFFASQPWTYPPGAVKNLEQLVAQFNEAIAQAGSPPRTSPSEKQSAPASAKRRKQKK